MSRIATLSLTDPARGQDVNPFGFRIIGADNRRSFEAVPHYTQIAVRLRHTSGIYSGYDGTATWTRVPIPNSSVAPVAYSDITGIDVATISTPTGTDCAFMVGPATYSIPGGNELYFYDPKKQRLDIFGTSQVISSAGFDLSIPLPLWSVVGSYSATDRAPFTHWGFAGVDSIDSSGWSDSQWRDYRGTYSVTSGPVQLDWTLS